LSFPAHLFFMTHSVFMGNTSSGVASDEKPSKSGKKGAKKGCMATKGKRKSANSSNPKSSKIAKLETAKYVYDKLFVEGQDSDISITALGYRWKLHKFYLKQCDYFSALLEGEWKDSKKTEYTIEIPDENITKDGLHSVLGALYDNEIVFDVDKLRSIIAAASFLQLTSVFERASEAIVTSIDDATVLEFLECGYRYGIDEVTEKAFDYLRWNLWRLSRSVSFLRNLPEEALTRLVACIDLPVVEGELDLYKAIRSWIVLHESDGYLGDDPELLATEVTKYLKMLKYAWDNDVSSMVSTAGTSPSSTRHSTPSTSSCDEIHGALSSQLAAQPYSLFLKYSQLFAGLRLHSLCYSTSSINHLIEDALLPPSLVDAVIADRHFTQLSIDEHRVGDINRQSTESVSEEAFLLGCTRFGRTFGEVPKCWRWTGSHYGVDLLMNMQSTMLTMKRNMYVQPSTYSLNQKDRISISYRVIILSENGTVIRDTKKASATLGADAVVVVTRFAKGELPSKFSLHLFVLYGAPSPNPSFVMVGKAVKQLKQLTRPVLDVDNVSLLDEEEKEEDEEEEEE
ncbi:hypothetical protein PFISCL1PPCAC_14999, partial [Pristionchus fissidentatus]